MRVVFGTPGTGQAVAWTPPLGAPATPADWEASGALELSTGLTADGTLEHFADAAMELQGGLSGDGSYSGYVHPEPRQGGRGRLWKHPKIVDVEGKLLEQDDEDWRGVLRALEAAERSAEKVLAKRVVRLGRAKESISEIRAEIQNLPQSTWEIEQLKARVTDSLAWLQRSRAAEYRRLLREIERKQREIEDEEEEWFLMQ